MHESLYRGSAEYYVAGRLPYARELVDAFPLDASQRLLDVGCGPGSLTLLLAPRVRAAVGVDADAGMLAEAARQAKRTGIANVEWRRLRAEDLPANLGSFDVATFAQSFHWMDQPVVAAAVRDMLTPGGALVLVGATTHRGDGSDDPLPYPRPPHERIAELARAHADPPPRTGRAWVDDELRAVGLEGPEAIEVPSDEIVTRTAGELVAMTFSLSFASPHRFGPDRDRFEADLRALLAEVSPGGTFAERRRGDTLQVWRTPTRP